MDTKETMFTAVAPAPAKEAPSALYEQSGASIDDGGPPVSAPDPVSQHEKIACLAYSYWEARGCPDGSPEEDWFRAEQDILQK